MLTKIEVSKTYWIGISETQQTELRSAVVKLKDFYPETLNEIFTLEEQEALNEFRQAMLNV